MSERAHREGSEPGPRQAMPAAYVVPCTGLAWRTAVVPWPALWADWAFSLCLWWIFYLGVGRLKAGRRATLAYSALLLGLYVHAQAPNLSRVLWPGP